MKELFLLFYSIVFLRGKENKKGLLNQTEMSATMNPIQSQYYGLDHNPMSRGTEAFGEGDKGCIPEGTSTCCSLFRESPSSSLGGESATLTEGSGSQNESDSSSGTKVELQPEAGCDPFSYLCPTDINGVVVESATSICMSGIAKCRVSKPGQVVRIPHGTAPVYWLISTVRLTDWSALQTMWDALQLSNPTMGCKAWMLFDVHSHSWIGVFLMGVVEKSTLWGMNYDSEQVMALCMGLEVNPSLFSLQQIALLPWSEYSAWYNGCCDLLSVAAQTWESGRQIQEIESRLHLWMESCYVLSDKGGPVDLNMVVNT